MCLFPLKQKISELINGPKNSGSVPLCFLVFLQTKANYSLALLFVRKKENQSQSLAPWN